MPYNFSPARAVILSSARTGSTWLGETLKHHHEITYDGEILRDHLGEPPRDKIDFISRNQATCSTPMHLWKLQKHHMFPEMETLLRLDERLIIIFLRRENLLAWYVSNKVSQQLGVYTCRLGDVIPEAQPFRVDVEELCGYLEDETSWWRWVRANLSHPETGLAYTEVTYEQLCEDYVAQAERLFFYLGMEPVPVAQTTLKMQKRDPRKLITNYSEVLDAIPSEYTKDRSFGFV